jgi:hypothetical protein
VKEVPRFEIVWPTQNFQNSPLSRSAPGMVHYFSPKGTRHVSAEETPSASDKRKRP